MTSPADPSQPPALTPSLAAARDRNSLRTVIGDDQTVDIRVSGSPIIADDLHSGSRIYLRALNFGVTEEAQGRYAARPNGELGRGAIGRVFVADDLHLGRPVAVKELLDGAQEDLDGTLGLKAVSRFLREARVTGALEHPNIVPVYELGRRRDGTLYYTMRIVPGRTLAQAIAEAPGSPERLSLVNHFSGLCQAIAYAHSRGIVHRDIKPDNVMIGEFGETVVLDWGMAKRVTVPQSGVSDPPTAMLAREGGELTLTLAGSVCGTPLYMSPEQASGRSAEVDERSDVWSLGVVLYTILSGQPPFSGENLLAVMAAINAGRYTPLRKLDPQIPPELAAVVERALQAKPIDRYPSARELAHDVQAYQAGTRVAAYEYSSLELFRRFVARHRAAVTASALACVVMLASSVVAYQRVVAARDRALVAEQHARDNELATRKSAERARHSLGEVLLDRAEQALEEGDSVSAELLAARALGQEERADARGVVIAAQSALRPALLGTLSDAKGCTHTALSFAADRFVCATGRELRVYALRAKELRLTRALPADVTALALASDGSALATTLADGTLRVELAPFTEPATRNERCADKPTAVAVADGGHLFACANARGHVAVWQGSAVERWELGQAASAMAVSKDGSELAVGGELGALVAYDVEHHEQRHLAGHTGTVLALALVEQGHYLASGAADRTVRFWDTAKAVSMQAPIVHSDAVSALGWSEDRRFVTLGGRDKTFRVSDLRTGKSALMRRHDEALELAAISADGSELASYSPDVGLRAWNLTATHEPTELNERGNVLVLGLGTSPNQLLSAGLGRNGVCVWDLDSGSCGARLPVPLDRVRALALSADRRKLALAGSGSQIFIWDLERKIPTQVIADLPDETRALSFSLDGRLLVAAGLDRKLRVYDANSAALLLERAVNAAIQTLSAAPAGLVLAGDQAGMISVWDLGSGQIQASWHAHSDRVLGGALSPDGSSFASAGADRLVKVWSVRTRKLLFSAAGHDGKVLSVDFSANGSLLASAGEDKTVRLWDARTGRALATLTGHTGAVRAVRFGDRPGLLASGADDGAIRLWHLADLARPGPELERALTQQFELEPSSKGDAEP